MNTLKEFEIPYPRKTFRRKVLNLLGKTLIHLLTHLKISGLENIPSDGPVILAGNHLSNLEPVLMVVAPRRFVELIGAGDLPFLGLIDKIVSFYGFIPVNRGNLDRIAMNQALGILEQDGVLGIFPEGGIWDPGHMKAQVGVAWLSHRAQAPVVPIGFSGFQNSLSRALKLKRPHLKMRIGKLIPALSFENEDQAIKTVYQEYADNVLEQIKTLIDPQDFLLIPEHSDYNLQVLVGKDDRTMEVVALLGSDAMAQFLFSIVLMDSLAVNLKIPVHALYPKEQTHTNQQFLDALRAAIDFLQENPGFFTYRMGMERGQQVEKTLHELADLLVSARESDKTVVINASVHSRFPDGRIEEKSHQYRILPELKQSNQD